METNTTKKQYKTGAQRLVWWGWLLVLVPLILLAVSYLAHFIIPESSEVYGIFQSIGIIGVAGGVALSPFGVLFLIIGYIKRFFETRKK